MSTHADGGAPVVGVVMGSDSDWPVMEGAVVALEELGVACEVDVVSAHRMPEEMVEYGRSAEGRGLRVIIAGAGGAAHLPGMLASVTSLPVIGVPVPLKYLDGMDSLLSIVQMPSGVPVATVSVGGALQRRAAGRRILGAGEGAEAERLRGALAQFRENLREQAHAKGAALRDRRSERGSRVRATPSFPEGDGPTTRSSRMPPGTRGDHSGSRSVSSVHRRRQLDRARAPRTRHAQPG